VVGRGEADWEHAGLEDTTTRHGVEVWENPREQRTEAREPKSAYTYKQLMPERQNTAKQEDTRGLRVAEIGKVESAMWS
jgi:hypothetical protein